MHSPTLPMPQPLAQPPGSFLTACQEICRTAGSNFTAAFAFLPKRQREAMVALYAFMRQTDDLSDEPGDPTEKARKLALWEVQLGQAIDGPSAHSQIQAAPCCEPVLEAASWLVQTFGVKPDYFREVIKGVRADLDFTGFANRAEQDAYCYRVASVVGLCCIRIWGATDPRAESPSIATGLAFQRTNILRDLKEDLEKGRCYIPRDVLDAFGARPEIPKDPNQLLAWTKLVQSEVNGCKPLYDAGQELFQFLPRPGRAVLLGFSKIYRSLLDTIAAHPESIWQGRTKISRSRKGTIFLRALIMRFFGC